MGQKKLERFSAIKSFSNVVEYPEDMAGKWQGFFATPQPLVLELACGKGEYAVGLGTLHPERNFLGVDVKGNRLFVGAKYALQNNLSNVGFMRCQISQVAKYFGANEVSEIWITFPDPQLRTGKAKKRLTHPNFLRQYFQFLKPGAIIHLKTDSPNLFQFTSMAIEHYSLRLVKAYQDVYKEANEPELLNIKTHYEGLDIAQSGKIFYLSFSLPQYPDPALDAKFKEKTIALES